MYSQRGDAAFPAMVCAACSYSYCFLHANAHEGQRCNDYTKVRAARLTGLAVDSCPVPRGTPYMY